MEGGDGGFQAVAADEPHGVVWAAVGIVAQAVDRDDPRMLETAGDLGLVLKPGAVAGIVGELRAGSPSERRRGGARYHGR